MKGKIFNAQEVQAIIAGTKTMFREVIKTQIKTNEPLNLAYTTPYRTWEWGNSGVYVEEPYEVGQKIFVKERFFVSNYIELRYEANLSIDEKYYWLPAIKMKQEHSRLTLLIKEIRVERLGDISADDCWKEGFKTDYKILPHGIFQKKASKFFTENWNATHKKPEEKFEANPFVWVVDFKINK